MMKSVFAAFVLVFATSAYAADTYKIDTKASTVTWKAAHKVGAVHDGGIAVKDGTVQVEKGQVSSGTITVDMTTITNNDLKDSPDYQKKLVGHLASGDFFNVEKYPTSTFKLTSITPKAKDEVLVKGELTMVGKTQPIEFPAKVTVAKGTVTGEANVTIDRTKWDLKYGSGNFFKSLTADKIINDTFELNLKLVAKK